MYAKPKKPGQNMQCIYVCIMRSLAFDRSKPALLNFQCVLELHTLLLPFRCLFPIHNRLARATLTQSSLKSSHTKRILYVVVYKPWCRGVSSCVVHFFACIFPDSLTVNYLTRTVRFCFIYSYKNRSELLRLMIGTY